MSELRSPSSFPPRCVVLTMPVVTVFCREKGLPMATTNSPGLRSADWPSRRTGNLPCKKWKKKENSNVKTQLRWQNKCYGRMDAFTG